MGVIASTGSAPARPLADWRFDGTLRHYQADVLERVEPVGGTALHIVAPPGSGKTLLGLLLAVRHGARAVAFAPTTTIRDQWARAAAPLAPTIRATPPVSTDPLAPADLTVLTYQAISVLGRTSPLDTIAEHAWRRELVGGGRADDDAAAWIADLATTNPDAHRAGIRRRSAAARKRLVREDPAVLAAALHPNAVALIDRLVAAGVETILLDECHHLLDHWAVVIAALAARIREAGRAPLLIGLTATLPSADDREAFENYTALLGEVDYEVPTPAVVKEGNLAPYRDFVRLVEPDDDEVRFLRAHERELADLVRGLLGTPEGVEHLVGALQPATARPAGAPEPIHDHTTDETRDAAIASAFAADFAMAEASARMLAWVAPEHPLVARLPPDAAAAPETEQRIRVLARFALDRVLPDPARAATWDRVRTALVDFGFTLTDRGIRRGRDPIDSVLASSAAKDAGAAEILRIELAQATGDRMRAVVVTDYAVHGNARGRGRARAGALRCFETIAGDASLAPLHPVLVTAKHLRIAARDCEVLLPRLAAHLGAELTAAPVTGSTTTLEVATGTAGSSAVVAAVSALLTEGLVRAVVGTRALLGEGWDCPAVNTLIDLTAVATSSATQQLRGRTLRLDPDWPRKVAHNWTVTAVLPRSLDSRDAPDVDRMVRKHQRIWGLLRDDATQVVRGLAIALSTRQRQLLSGILHGGPPIAGGSLGDRPPTPAAFNADVLAELPTRADSWIAWRVGEPYADRESVSALVVRPSRHVVRTGPTLVSVLALLLGVLSGALAIGVSLGLRIAPLSPPIGIGIVAASAAAGVWLAVPAIRMLVQAMRQLVGGEAAMRRIAGAVVGALQDAGRIGPTGHGDLRVAAVADPASGLMQFEVEQTAGSMEDRRQVADALAEMLGPIRTPRFLLEVEQGSPAPTRGARVITALALRVVSRLVPQRRSLPVPTALGRRRADAEAFERRWRAEVGPATLHEIASPEALARLAAARRHADGAPEPPRIREGWS